MVIEVTKNDLSQDIFLPSVIPNFSAALGKSPRSTIPNDKYLLEYLYNPKKKKV